MPQLFVPEYTPDGYPRLDQEDIHYMQQAQRCGVISIGYPSLEVPAEPVTVDDDLAKNLKLLEFIVKKDVERKVPQSRPLGIAAAQTVIRNYDNNTPKDIFLAKIDPEVPGGKLIDEYVPFINFTVKTVSKKLQQAKHGCLSTGPLSPIVATPYTFTFRALDRHRQPFSGRLTGMPAAVAWHEYMHNKGQLMVDQPNVSVVNCVPRRHLELSRTLSVEQSRRDWPLRYTAEQVAAIRCGAHALRLDLAA